MLIDEAVSQANKRSEFELIRTGLLESAPAIKEGFCLVCRYNPGYGQSDREILCTAPRQIDDINHRFIMGHILNVRWGQVPWAHALVKAAAQSAEAAPAFYH